MYTQMMWGAILQFPYSDRNPVFFKGAGWEVALCFSKATTKIAGSWKPIAIRQPLLIILVTAKARDGTAKT